MLGICGPGRRYICIPGFPGLSVFTTKQIALSALCNYAIDRQCVHTVCVNGLVQSVIYGLHGVVSSA